MSTDNHPETEAETPDVEQTEQEAIAQGSDDLQQQIDDLSSALAAAEAKIDEQKDSVIRAKAEADNARKRSMQEVDKAKKFALEKFANELLPIIDNLERALQVPNSEDETIKPLLSGVEMTLKLFLSTIEKFDLKVVEPTGETFNPELHQAMSMQPSDEVEPNTVLAVMQKGYTLNGRLLRPALVMVSKANDAGIDTEA